MTRESDRTLEPVPPDEALLTGYLDGELTQSESQRVEVWLDRSPEVRRLLADLEALRAAAQDTTFVVPTDDQWREAARTPMSRRLRLGGWSVLGLWAVATFVYLAWESVVASGEVLPEILALTFSAGLGALALSVLLDRLRDRPRDRYRRVLK